MKSHTGGKQLTIPYALVVTLDSSNVKPHIYEEVKPSLEQQIKQATKEKTSPMRLTHAICLIAA
ncbi:hypothetical protein [Aurantivibrio plasticivorans]